MAHLRYSSLPFPPYAYLPGANPHPTRDPRGHSYRPPGVGSEIADRRGGPPKAGRISDTGNRRCSPDEWRDLEAWLYGVDLFNAGYFWEAHEAWESLWAAVERTSPPALFLQGLIQIAAALLKVRQGVLTGARSLSGGGLEKLRQVSVAQPALMGLDLVSTIDALEKYFAVLNEGELPASDRVPSLELASMGQNGTADERR